MIFNLINFFGGVLILIFFVVLAFWKEVWAPLFMIAAGVSIMLGLETPRLISPTFSGTATVISQDIGLGLIVFSILMLAMAFKVSMRSEE